MLTTPGPAFTNRWMLLAFGRTMPSIGPVATFWSPTFTGMRNVSRIHWSDGSLSPSSPIVVRPPRYRSSVGVSGSLVTRCKVAIFGPSGFAAGGLNTMLMLSNPPAPMLAGVAIAGLKLNSDASAPVIEMPESVSEALPVFETVIVLAALAAPPRTSSNTNWLLLTTTFGSCGRNSVIFP